MKLNSKNPALHNKLLHLYLGKVCAARSVFRRLTGALIRAL